MKNKLGLYLHVPFCASKCTYCDFYSFAGSEQQIEQYMQAMQEQIAYFASKCKHHQVDTIYFGGGTPSLLGADRLIMLLHTIVDKFALTHHVEITVECNPDSMNKELLRQLKREGVNRLSIGVQSAHDDELKRLGRRHTFAQAVQAITQAKQEGFSNISLDLMYGLPGQTTQKWIASIQALLELDPTHLSCYSLKVEPNTPLGRENPILPDDDMQADWYLQLCTLLEQQGYLQYEVSNWSKEGYRSRHNSRYWTQQDYLGIGPGAHSYCFGKRFFYPPSLHEFCSQPKVVEEETIQGFSQKEEYFMLRLRMTDGISIAHFCQQFGEFPYQKQFEGFEKVGLAARTPMGWRLTPKGFLVSNSILTSLLTGLE